MNPLNLVVLGFLCSLGALAQEAPTPERAAESMLRAARLFRDEASFQGSYVWQYSLDFKLREGEGQASSTQGWMQPPGTPAVGFAFLEAWKATGDDYYLDAARETANAIRHGQLRSGGWHYMLEFDPSGRKKIAYRTEGGGANAHNITTLDDDVTQSALRFLVRMDQALGFAGEKILETVSYAIDRLLAMQYPNGAWPQAYDKVADNKGLPIRRASYPTEWSRTWPGSKQYSLHYTLNDGALTVMIQTLLEVNQAYGGAPDRSPRSELARRARKAAERAGDFLLLAQLPAPQPAWAQQYDFDMHPAWARKFEPPAITAGESQGVLRALMVLYRETGNPKYLEPIPRALEYLRSSRLDNGRLARFYELESNKPLYFTRSYQLTHRDDDLPTHYAFTVSDQTDAISREFEALTGTPGANPARPRHKPALPGEMLREVQRILAAQDDRGAWPEPGTLRTHQQAARMIIKTATFNKNMKALADYLTALKSVGDH